MSNATILQNHNEIIGNNNLTIDELIESINNLPEAGSGEVSLQEKTITPTTSSQIVEPDEDYDGLSKVTVNPISEEYIIPSGTLDITENGIYDVTNYATANVNIANDTSEIEEAIITRSLTEYYNDTITSIGANAFTRCTQLTSVSFTKATNIGAYAFLNCTKLTDVNLPMATTLNTDCIRDCTVLVNVELPEVTSAGTTAFYNDKELTTVKLPKLKKIDRLTFGNCPKLTTLIIEQTDTICSLASNSFQNSGITSGTGYVYVPDELVDSYKNATNWSNYANQIKGLSELEG